MTNAPALTPAMRILFLLATAAVALWGMSNYADYINSGMLAVLIVLACGPLTEWLRRRHLPKWAVLVLTLLAALAGIALFVLFLIYATAQFVRELPTYQEEAQALVADLQSWLQSMGLDADGSGALASRADATGALSLAESFLTSLSNALSNGFTMTMLMVFLFVDVILFPGRLAWQGAHGSTYARRVGDFTGSLRQYIVVMAVMGTAIGALNSILFYLLGVPMPLLWGVLSGILNFIPFIGFWIGLIMPAILTLLSQGLGPMLVMSAGYILINATAQNVIQPRLVVTHLNLTPFMSLLSSTFWPLVLGPLGAIIGVPLTMGVHTLLLDTDPTTRWLAAMMTATHAEQTETQAAESHGET